LLSCRPGVSFARIIKYDYNAASRTGLDAICLHLLDASATNYIAGIAVELGGWGFSDLDPKRRQQLATFIPFANYNLMKTLINRPDGFSLLDKMPELWDDPVLADWLQGYLLRHPGLSWTARRYADKLKSAPVFSNSETARAQPQPRPVIIIVPPSAASRRTNHIASAQLISAGAATAQKSAAATR
jgi:hypothetical protein